MVEEDYLTLFSIDRPQCTFDMESNRTEEASIA